jgi:hypothetical protein
MARGEAGARDLPSATGARPRAADRGHVTGGGGRRSVAVARPSAPHGGRAPGCRCSAHPGTRPGCGRSRTGSYRGSEAAASGLGARPAPGDGAAAGDTTPAAIRIRGRHLLCLIGIATDVSLQECWLPADITPRNSIEISAIGPISLQARAGLDQWSSEDGAVSVPARRCGADPGRMPHFRRRAARF